jgi:diguanylate cyclase (GGDEF)-like protein
MGKSMRYGRPLSVVLFDLDDFKDVNDAHGHDHGDLVLREVVKAVRPVLRPTGLTAGAGKSSSCSHPRPTFAKQACRQSGSGRR